MNTTFTRLMWKEYRAQRMLWTVLLLGWLGLHLIFIFNEQSVLDAAAVILMIPVCFLVAAATIAFAGEEDDKTSNLLRMLPCRTSSLMSAKVTTIIVGCATLCLSMLVLSATLEFMLRVVYEICLVFLSGPLPLGIRIPVVRRSDPNGMPWQDGETLYAPAFLALVFASAMFASMNARSIFSAVGATAVIVLGIMITAFSITSDVRQYQLGVIAPWIAGVAAILMAISTIFLSRPWHLGRLPRRWAMPGATGDFSARRIPSFAWFWRRWARRIVARPLTLRRGLSMLTWRECCSAVPFALTWLSIGMLICAGRCFSTGGYPWPFMFLLVFIHECGQRTMREDQRSGSVLLLANAGVHPLQIWIAKMSIWLGVMCVVGFAVIETEALVPRASTNQSSQNPETSILNAIDMLRVPEFGRPFGRHDTPSTSADHWLQASVCLAAALGLFSIGQLTACWIRRQIIAFAASFIVTIAAAFLFLDVIMKDWPVWIALFPIPFCLLLATATTARQWIDRSVTWRLRIRQTVLLVLPCVVFPLLGFLAWSSQPFFAVVSLGRDPGNAVYSLYNLQNPAAVPEIDQLIALTRSPWSEWDTLDNPADTQCWLEFAAAVRKFPLHQMMLGQFGPDGGMVLYEQRPWLLSQSQFLEKGPDPVRDLLKPFDTVLAEKNRFPSIPVMWTAPWSNTPAVALSMALLEDARHRENNGDTAGAVQQIVRAIHANRSLAMQTSSWKNWLVCLDAERVALGRLRLILGSADLSTVDLDALLAELKSTLVGTHRDGGVFAPWQDPQLMLQRRTLFWSTAVFSDDAFLENLRKLPDDQRGFESQNTLAQTIQGYRAFEPARAIYTMWLSEALLAEKYRSMTIDGRARFTGAPQSQRILQLKRFMATSGMADLNIDLLAAESDHITNNVFMQHVDTIASERATLLTIMLQQYRLVHGQFPDSLVSLLDLPNGDPSSTIIQTDPWTGGPFLYAATGHKLPLKLHFGPTSLRITPAQPLLFSAGGYGLRFQSYFASPSLSEPSEMYKLPPNVVVFLGLSDDVDWRIGQIATSVTVLPLPVVDAPVPATDWLPGQMGAGEEQQQ